MKHPLILRLIHWLTFLLLLPMLIGGYFVIRTLPSNDPLKLDSLTYHMAIGMFIAALTLIRLVLRRRLPHPQATGLALWAHRGLYALILLMPVSGMTMALAGKLNEIVFARSGAPLPADMATIPGHFWHGLTALLLTALILLHIAGALKDRATIKRML